MSSGGGAIAALLFVVVVVVIVLAVYFSKVACPSFGSECCKANLIVSSYYSNCSINTCNVGYTLDASHKHCVTATCDPDALDEHGSTFADYPDCSPLTCVAGFDLKDGICAASVTSNTSTNTNPGPNSLSVVGSNITQLIPDTSNCVLQSVPNSQCFEDNNAAGMGWNFGLNQGTDNCPNIVSGYNVEVSFASLPDQKYSGTFSDPNMTGVAISGEGLNGLFRQNTVNMKVSALDKSGKAFSSISQAINADNGVTACTVPKKDAWEFFNSGPSHFIRAEGTIHLGGNKGSYQVNDKNGKGLYDSGYFHPGTKRVNIPQDGYLNQHCEAGGSQKWKWNDILKRKVCSPNGGRCYDPEKRIMRTDTSCFGGVA